jgi:DNA-binding beta-propeller fold protein YncE
MSARLRLSLPALLAILLAAVIGQAPIAAASANQALQPARSALGQFGSFGSALVGSAPVQPGPSAVAVDRATNTIYVANGNNANGPTSPGGDTVSVIDGRRCNAPDVSRCPGPWPTIKVGNLPSTIAVDQATDTVYVTIIGNNAVAVFNGATCNAQNTSGCGQAPAHVQVGPAPFGIFADDANHTVYVANPGPNFDQDTISMINTLTCNASDLGGCASHTPATVPVATGPSDFDVNQATHTVYVATVSGVAAFDASTCNATVLTGCGQIGMLPAPSSAPAGINAVSVDSANNTIYAAPVPSAIPGNTISAFDGRRCNASDLAGCAAGKSGTVTVAPPEGFEVAFWLVLDVPLHTVYVVNQKDDTLSAVSTDVCNGRHLSACATLQPPTIHTGEDPESVALNPATQTLYTANQVTNDVSVIDAARCNATITSGCRRPPPAIALTGPGASAADPAAATLYVTTGSNTVSMIDTASCNASHPAGCTTPPTVTVGAGPNAVAVDLQTHTVYVANAGNGSSGTVSVINAATCNATHSAGCATPASLQVPGGNPDGIAVDAATGTIYVATLTSSGPNLISVFNANTCNATHTTGCSQSPAVLSIGDSGGAQFGSALSLAIDQATNTIYATNVITNTVPFGGDSVYVINGATCDAATTAGCGQTPATVKAGFNPWGIAVDQATDTIYTANIADGEHPGTVSVINGATCNGTNQTGCGQTPATAPAGFGAIAVAIDPANQTAVVTNIEDTSISVINTASCNAIITSGCHHPQPKFPAGRAPNAVAIDPAAGTIYTSNGDNTVSIIPTNQ